MLICFDSFLESFINRKLSDDAIFNAGICQNCFIKFNEYDEHLQIASRIQGDLMQLYENFQDTSEDVKLDVKRELEMAGYGIVEVMLDNDDVDVEYNVSDGSLDVLNKSKRSPKKIKSPRRLELEKRAYRRKKNLDEGLTVVEVDGVKIYQCEVCKKLCKDRYKLRTHREIHTTERTVCCNECGAMFKTLTCLYSHKKIHKERVYHQCDHCEMRYIQKTQLRKHMDAIHLKKKDHICSICGELSD